MERLTQERLAQGAAILAGQETVFQQIIEDFGLPTLWVRPPGLRTLVYIIVEQKISIDSALAVMQRIDALCPDIAEGFSGDWLLSLSDEQWRQAGLSRAKWGYCRAVALAIKQRDLELDALLTATDGEVLTRLMAVKGIGPWTAGVYLMVALGRVDGWASGDRALVVSLAELEDLPAVPSYRELDERAAHWAPWRGVAARLLWHAYLVRRGRRVPDL